MTDIDHFRRNFSSDFSTVPVRLMAVLCLLDWYDGGLYQTAESQVLLDNDVVDGGHDEPDLHGIRCAREMSVNLLRGVLV